MNPAIGECPLLHLPLWVTHERYVGWEDNVTGLETVLEPQDRSSPGRMPFPQVAPISGGGVGNAFSWDGSSHEIMSPHSPCTLPGHPGGVHGLGSWGSPQRDGSSCKKCPLPCLCTDLFPVAGQIQLGEMPPHLCTDLVPVCAGYLILESQFQTGRMPGPTLHKPGVTWVWSWRGREREQRTIEY